MTILLRILAFLSIIWFMARFVAHLFRKQPARPNARAGGMRNETSKNMVKDPVCGMYMDPRLAVRMEGKEGDVFFCSEECRQRYLNRP